MVVAVAIIFELVPGAQRGASAQDTSRPNILIIVTDDERATRSGRFQPDTKAWLKDGGMTFTNAFASTPVCCPSRASILTGRYAHNHGVLSNGGGVEPGGEALVHATTMQAYLQEAGYRTGVVGKLLNGWPLKQTPPYWDYFSIFSRGYRDTRWNINGTVETISTYSTKFIGRRVSGFIQESETTDGQPWMLYLAPYAPHNPWDPERSVCRFSGWSLEGEPRGPRTKSTR